MNLALVGATHFGNVASPWKGQVPSGSDAGTPVDRVTIGGGEVPAALTTHTAAQAPPSTPTRSLKMGVMLGLMVAGSMLGGCASLAGNGLGSAHSLAQNVTGRMVKTGFDSISYIDQQVTPLGGGLYSEKDASKESRLAPLDATDRMLDGKPIYYKAKADARPQAVRSWAELRGFEQMLRDTPSK